MLDQTGQQRERLPSPNRHGMVQIPVGTFGMELGATTVFLYGMREREKVLDLFELITGLRMNHAYIRPGGVSQDLPAGAIEKLRAATKASSVDS